MPQPNVLSISTHDINPHLGCYRDRWPGAEQAFTPVLDELANEGVIFTNAFAVAPVCSPSRSSIMTGCFPTTIGTMHHRTKAVPPPEVHLLPEYFRAAGYYTTVNALLDAQVMAPPTTFDDVSQTAHWRNRPRPDMPFFASFNGSITHESQIYLDDDEFLAATSHVTDQQRHDPAQVVLPPYHPDTAEFRKSWARYLDLISEMDHWVGELLRQLDEDGLADSTIVVFWSDHGVGMPRGKRWLNESGLHEPLIMRWPGRIAPQSVRTDLVSLMDLAPTLLAACGLPVPPHMQGVRLLNGDGDAVPSPNEYVYSTRDRMDEQEDASRSVRDRRYRYIRHFHPDRSPMQHCEYPDRLATWQEFRNLYFGESEQLARGENRSLLTPLQRSLVAATKPREELYDLDNDPHEVRNLADDPAHRETLERLSDLLDEWLTRVNDLGLGDESALIEEWRPGGRPQKTETPSAVYEAGLIRLSCATAGASIGWTTQEPVPTRGDPFLPHMQLTGVEPNDRGWSLYTGPITGPDVPVYVRAWRIGFDPSDEIVVEPEPSNRADETHG